jgi:hypothetical protein
LKKNFPDSQVETKERRFERAHKGEFSKNLARESSFTNGSRSCYYLLKRAHFLGLDPGVKKFHPVTLTQSQSIQNLFFFI